ncbi:HAD-IA family hydrolase [Actinotalea sp. M2MS4P-6]|uniref:HAD-IA family hydrolase n=1 Tax=Actinotalea sp. M2MS4P-6 TaxID=2983762 RepID=UPI0021E4B54D|nr:HAD-IA family hydrolase [Actinotalea sp. M2MS4P-6]MCV2395655.1 HAD-IA family hydrolase [Actinotalea sp. M2MS4P-6]
MTTCLLFDCDGVLADTERDGHLVAFNRMFAELGVPLRWSDEEYARLVRIGGGKERLAAAMTPEVAERLGLRNADAVARAIAGWHRRKSDLYRELVASGAVPARPGVRRLVAEAVAAGWQVAVASTSAPGSVLAVLEHAVGPALAAEVRVFAGDVVPRKKPSPDIYLHALAELGGSPGDAVVVEDSGIGLAAARAAGLPVVVTVSSYTVDDDVTGASLVLSDLGEPGAPGRVLDDPLDLKPGAVDVALLREVIAAGAG